MNVSFLRNIIVLTIIFYFVFVQLGKREDGQKIICVPKFISFILGNPLKDNKLNLVCLLGNISNLINLILYITLHFSRGYVVAAKVYGISLAVTFFISSVIIGIIQRDII